MLQGLGGKRFEDQSCEDTPEASVEGTTVHEQGEVTGKGRTTEKDLIQHRPFLPPQRYCLGPRPKGRILCAARKE